MEREFKGGRINCMMTAKQVAFCIMKFRLGTHFGVNFGDRGLFLPFLMVLNAKK